MEKNDKEFIKSKYAKEMEEFKTKLKMYYIILLSVPNHKKWEK
jgi:hypothetical protein